MGIKPRYNPRTPPSSRITFIVIPHIVNSAFEKGAATARAELADDEDEVWYADANAGFAAELAVDEPGLDMAIDAVAIDNRDRTRSRGYVVPTREKTGCDIIAMSVLFNYKMSRLER